MWMTLGLWPRLAALEKEFAAAFSLKLNVQKCVLVMFVTTWSLGVWFCSKVLFVLPFGDLILEEGRLAGFEMCDENIKKAGKAFF